MVVAAGLPALASAAALAGGGPGIGRRAAQQMAHRELSRAIYQPSIFQRLLDWLGRLFSRANVSLPGGWWALIALIIVVVVVVTLVILRIRPARKRRGTDRALLADQQLSARDHREEAGRRAAAGDYSAAIIEQVRAIAIELEERGILPPRPGRTAFELAAEAGRALPPHAGALASAAALFDDVMYGGRNGSRAGYQRVRDLDAAVQAARPAGAAALAPAGSAAGPVP